MIFTELRFPLFFLVVFGIHWALRAERGRKLWLLAASYFFYAAWDWRFLSLILISTLVDYTVGRALDPARGPAPTGRARRRWLLASLVVNLGLLGVFKYCDFFLSSAAELLTWFGVERSEGSLSLVLPVGISFYTFQTMSYTLDVYAGRMRARRSLLDMALFVAFFPQLVAGPIVRAATFLPQLDRRRRFAEVPVRAALVLFLVGCVKKACVSDNLAPVVDAYFAAPELYDAASAWLAVLFYAVQIYCDFSGYSDMAIACAALLGYRLCLNFNFPYFATSITTFWRRWHISLSSWLRDYLYIPLGGNRHGRRKARRNLMWTMLLGGLWHGAAWRFIVWGALHGLALAWEREWGRWRPSKQERWRGWSVLSSLATFWWVCLAWIFFRAQDFGDAWVATRAYVLFQSPGTESLDPRLFLLFPALVAVHWSEYRRGWTALAERLPPWAFSVGYALAVHAVLLFYRPSAQPFIYFQF